ncbi:MAG TPA: hypothetical protein VK815_18130 [Candidatus Acidoferrales bacterium]|jgi:hypothetical protein|nr:hypothetical protein [Candidatus Acidoferrales bacterium]
MNTRRATDGSFHQSRFASSPEFNHGLAVNLVEMRVAVLDDPAMRELIWWVQYQSHQPGGLAAFARELIAKYPARIQTQGMLDLGLKPGELHTSTTVKKLRHHMPLEARCQFYLAGERDLDYWGAPSEPPDDYPSEKFIEVCHAAARQNLEKDLKELCLNPDGAGLSPWYFPRLVETLMEVKRLSESESSGLVKTSATSMVHDFLDYTQNTGGLTLLTGPSNVGAKFAAREWCQRRPGRARFVEVPPSNDEASFFRTIGKALGGNFTNYKNVQIRERVESVLQSADIMLVLFAAQNLWPQKNLREAFPTRLAWLIDQTEKGAAVGMISGPQFFMQKRSCDKSAWDTEELQGVFAHVAALPVALTVEEMTSIARAVLPAATDDDCELIAISAVGSERYLANLDATAKRAQFLADRTGRGEMTTGHIGQAIAIVNQSETLLKAALADNPKARKRQPAASAARPGSEEITPAPGRNFAAAQDSAPAIAPRSARGGVLIHQANAV